MDESIFEFCWYHKRSKIFQQTEIVMLAVGWVGSLGERETSIGVSYLQPVYKIAVAAGLYCIFNFYLQPVYKITEKCPITCRWRRTSMGKGCRAPSSSRRV